MADAVAAAGLDNLKIFDREDRKWRRLQLESVLHRKRVFVPKVDPRNPFRQEGQLMDQYELRELNRVRRACGRRVHGQPLGMGWCQRVVLVEGCGCGVAQPWNAS